MADDGEQYTLKEFRDYYGDEAQELWDAAEVPSKEPSVEPAKEDATQPNEEPESEDKKIFNIEAMNEWWQSVKRPSDRPTNVTIECAQSVQRHEDLKSIEHPTETFNIEAMKEWMVKKD